MKDIKNELKNATNLAGELLRNLSTKDLWSEEDERKLSILTKITMILGKLSEVKFAKDDDVEFEPSRDKEIIQRFIKRYITNEKSAENNCSNITE